MNQANRWKHLIQRALVRHFQRLQTASRMSTFHLRNRYDGAEHCHRQGAANNQEEPTAASVAADNDRVNAEQGNQGGNADAAQQVRVVQQHRTTVSLYLQAGDVPSDAQLHRAQVDRLDDRHLLHLHHRLYPANAGHAAAIRNHREHVRLSSEKKVPHSIYCTFPSDSPYLPIFEIYRNVANCLEILNHCLNFYVFCMASSDYTRAFLLNCLCIRRLLVKIPTCANFIYARRASRSAA